MRDKIGVDGPSAYRSLEQCDVEGRMSVREATPFMREVSAVQNMHCHGHGAGCWCNEINYLVISFYLFLFD